MVMTCKIIQFPATYCKAPFFLKVNWSFIATSSFANIMETQRVRTFSDEKESEERDWSAVLMKSKEG